MHGPAGLRDLFLHQSLAGVILQGKPPKRFQGLRVKRFQMAAAEHHNALPIRRPGFILDGFVPVNGEAHLVTGLERIDLVPDFRPVKIELLRGFVIKVVDGNGIGVAVIAIYGQNAPAGLPQKLLGGLKADLVFLSANGSKHTIALLLF